MSTTTTTTTATPASSSLAASAKFKAFAIACALTAPVLYVLCDIFGLPLFTYHPATNRVDLGWAPGRSGEGPAMYWYGWTATTILGAAIVGAIATLFPERKVSAFTIWTAPILISVVMLIVASTGGGEKMWLYAGVAVAITVVACAVTWRLPESTNSKILLNLLWLLPILAMIPLWISLQPFWDKGGGFF
jgi:hypothetical protein